MPYSPYDNFIQCPLSQTTALFSVIHSGVDHIRVHMTVSEVVTAAWAAQDVYSVAMGSCS